MKKLDTTYTGGMPINLADLRWMNNGVIEALNGYITAICPADQIVILSGCTRSVTGSTVTIAAGIIAYGGEIFIVPSHSFASTTTDEYWSAVTVMDPSGTKLFQNASTHDVYEEVIYKVVTGSAPSTEVVYSNSLYYADLIAAMIPQDSWHNLVTQTVSGTNYAIDYKLDFSGFVHFRGKYYVEDIYGVVDVTIGTLPAGYRPSVMKYYALHFIKNVTTGAVGSAYIQIDTAGVIKLKSIDGDYANFLEFSQVVPFDKAV